MIISIPKKGFNRILAVFLVLMLALSSAVMITPANAANSSYEQNIVLTYAVESVLQGDELGTGYESSVSTDDLVAAASSLKINPTAYPTGSLPIGSYYSIQGTVTSNYKITSVKGEIINSKGKTVCSYTQKPNTKDFSFLNSNLDYNMTFNKLSSGSYKLKYTAKDASGKTVTWTSKSFTIAKSNLKINPTSYPTGTLTAGSYYSLKGTVTSNCNIVSVKGEILNSSGKSVCSYTQKPNAKTFDFYNSSLDSHMTFNKLSAGKYRTQYTAKDSSGNSVTWKSDLFTVTSKAGQASTTSNKTYKLCWPLPSSRRKINSGLGYRIGPITGQSSFHQGIDIDAPVGTKVMAAADGIVTVAAWNHSRGYHVVVYHPSLGLTSIYQHLSSYSVQVGQSVKKGQKIAESGNTGDSTGPHLHFGLVKTSSAPNSADCDWGSNAPLVDGSYDNPSIKYTYKK